ncbi:MAG: hypothetical protein J7M40_15410 [Planctomycetes bacterium]|nr:hypothetical protein [Planctomycetota bacterium]
MSKVQQDDNFKLSHLADEVHVDEHGSCQLCRWWHLLDKESAPADDNARMCRRQEEGIGECRCSEPRLVSCLKNGKQEYEGLWPITYEKDWCGKFEALKGKGGLASGRARF